MTVETLKELIEVEFDRTETISHFKKEVFRLIELYDKDKNNISTTIKEIINSQLHNLDNVCNHVSQKDTSTTVLQEKCIKGKVKFDSFDITF